MINRNVSRKSITNLMLISFALGFSFVQTRIYAQTVNPVEDPPPKSRESQEIIRVESELVTVPVTVLDRNGRYIANLIKEEFRVFENGTEQEISSFEDVRSPVTVFLLLDVSGSLENRLSHVASAANQFIGRLHPDDQLITAQFCGYIKMLNKLSTVRDIKGKGLKLKSCGWTRLYDAVDFAFAKLNKISGRKAIILLSDGADAGISARYPVAFVTEKDNYRLATESETLVYTVQFDTFAERRYLCKQNAKQCEKDEATARRYMETMPSITGGKQIIVDREADLAKSFTEIADELGHQYVLAYYPKLKPERGEKREIRVKVTRPGLAVRARQSYVGGKTK